MEGLKNYLENLNYHFSTSSSEFEEFAGVADAVTGSTTD